MILDELNVATDEAIAITDGGRSHADKLYQSSAAINVVPPPVTNCVQSELYYPHLLLADLVAGVIADAVVDGASIPSSTPQSYSIEHIMDTTDERFSERWNRGYSAVSRNEGEVQRPTYQQWRADSVRERANCWFHGHFGSTRAPPPESDGILPVVNRLDAIGCDDVASWLNEQ